MLALTFPSLTRSPFLFGYYCFFLKCLYTSVNCTNFRFLLPDLRVSALSRKPVTITRRGSESGQFKHVDRYLTYISGHFVTGKLRHQPFRFQEVQFATNQITTKKSHIATKRIIIPLTRSFLIT